MAAIHQHIADDRMMFNTRESCGRFAGRGGGAPGGGGGGGGGCVSLMVLMSR
jgi:hypothetical protein